MSRVIVRPRARVDIDDLWTYIADDSEVQADSFVDRLTAKFELLASRPEVGRSRNDLITGLRSFPFDRYVIFTLSLQRGST